MIRRHLVTVAVGTLALAIGIAAGAGPLGEAVRPAADAVGGTTRTPAAPTSETGDRFAASVAPQLYDHRLAGHPVALLVLPGAPTSTVSALQAQVRSAGGTITGTFAATRTLLDAGQISLVDTLGSQLATQVRVTQAHAGHAPSAAVRASTYARMGGLLGLAITTTDPHGTSATSTTTTVRRSLVAADLLALPGRTVTAAPLAPVLLVVLGDQLAQSAQAVLTGLVEGLGAHTVVAGATGSADLAVVRADPRSHVLAVDGSEAAIGQVSAVLDLIHVLA